MMNDWNARLREKKNKYRSLMDHAEQERMLNDNRHTLQECRYLQQAADITSELAQMTTGADRAFYMETLNRLDRQIALIRKEFETMYARQQAPKKKPEAPVPNPAAASDEETSAAPAADGENKAADSENDKAANVNTTGKNGKKEREAVSEEDVAGWYKEAPSHGFDGVSGMTVLKTQLADIVEDDQDNALRTYLKMKALHSYFFVGPPGCGKTHIVGAFAHELMERNYKYLSVDASDIKSRYVGDAEKIVKRLFAEAIKSAPCIVFVDEVDSICKSRKKNDLPEYAYSITTAFLTGFNDINNSDKKIIFIGATNYPQNIDSAVMDRVETVYVGLPDTEARAAAFQRALGDIMQLDEDLSYEYMAEMTGEHGNTPSYNYRDIDRLVENLKKTIYKEVKAEVGNGEEAVAILTSGEYKLSKELFDTVISSTLPSDKKDIIEGIDDWLSKVRDGEAMGD